MAKVTAPAQPSQPAEPDPADLALVAAGLQVSDPRPPADLAAGVRKFVGGLPGDPVQREVWLARATAALIQCYGLTPYDASRMLRAAREGAGNAAHLVTLPLGEVAPEAVTWAWPGRLPLGKLIVLEGDPGLGKSTLALDVAARVTTGAAWPDGNGVAPRGPVVILSAEDGPADTIRPRFDAARGDVALAHVVTGVVATEGEPGAVVTLPEHVGALRAEVDRTGALLVIVDPLAAYLSGAVNAHRDHDVRRALAPLAALAHETGATVLVIRHLNKGAGPAIYRGGGSIGISGAARAVLVVAQDPEDASRRVLAAVKSNLAPLPPSLTFALEDLGGVARVAWGAASPLTAGQLLAAQVGDEGEPSATDEASDFLRNELADSPRPAKELQRRARDAGISDKALRRARERLGVRPHRSGFGPGGEWTWALPIDAPRPPIDAQGAHTQRMGINGVSGASMDAAELERHARRLLRFRPNLTPADLLGMVPEGADPADWCAACDVVLVALRERAPGPDGEAA
jgi:hypothetical protein